MRYPLGWLVCEINIDIDVDIKNIRGKPAAVTNVAWW
jgi:hypothetical protein